MTNTEEVGNECRPRQADLSECISGEKRLELNLGEWERQNMKKA